MKKISTQIFIERARKIHGDKYDYSKVNYINSTTKVCIICPKHGEFWQNPYKHLHGQGCPFCSNHAQINKNEFIKRAKDVHGDKYDYSKVNYVNFTTEIEIICKKHGIFLQKPIYHINGHGCPICGKIKTNNSKIKGLDDFLEKAKKIHGDNYDYSLIENNVKRKDLLPIICKKHGLFYQTGTNHLKGEGCPICGNEKRNKNKIITKASFIERARKIHNDKYDYSKVKNDINNEKEKVCIICPIHGEFWQEIDSHLHGHGCPKCGVGVSNNEIELIDFLKENVGKNDVIERERNILKNHKEIDIYLPKYKIGIEYDGLHWHSEQFKNKKYHLNKTLFCKNLGINLIHIFEDEWEKNSSLVKRKILNLIEPNLIDLSNIKIKKIDLETSKNFILENNFKIFNYAKLYLGCYYNDELIAVMSLKSSPNNIWQIVQFITNNFYKAQNIFNAFIEYIKKNYVWKKILRIEDNRWECLSEKDYMSIGFIKIKFIKPKYKIVYKNVVKRFSRIKFTKKELIRKYNFPIIMTESEMQHKINSYKIWDCGYTIYELKK